MPIGHTPPKPPGEKADSEQSDFPGFEDETEKQKKEESVDPATASQIKALSRQRMQVKNKLLRIYATVNGHQLLEPAELEVFTANLKSIYAEHSAFHSRIVAIVPDSVLASQEEEYLHFERYYNWTSTAVKKLILQQQPPVTNSAAPAQVVIHQQPLKAPIPTFDGDYTKWPKFKAMFQDIMAQSRDPSSIKLYHLDKALVGAAAGVLDAKTINEGNYNHAWKILTERYENQRVIVETHIRGLLNLKKMSMESSKELRRLLDECTNHVESLQYLAQEVTGVSELIIVYLLTAALDKSTRKLWEQTLKSGELPKYEPTVAFLKSQCQVLEHCEGSCPTTTPKSTGKQAANPPKQTNPTTKQAVATQRSHAATTKSDDDLKCDICGASHRNYQCNILNTLSHAEKTEKVRSAGICFNCLRKGHLSKNCPSTKTCYKCQKRHHTQLHEDETKLKQEPKTSTTESPKPEASTESKPATQAQPKTVPSGSTVSTTCSCNAAATPKTVLLLTAVVQVTGKDNTTHNCRALLDSGSQANFITEAMANTLGVEKQRANIPISGINNVRSTARDKVQVCFQSRCSDYRATIECLVTPKVTGTIPTTNIDVSDWVIPDGIQLADPTFFKANKIDLLIGAELFFSLLKPGHVTLDDDAPELRNSHLGWLVTGTVRPRHDETLQYSHIASLESVDEAISKFWQLEEVPAASTISPEEQRCEDHFALTHTRDSTGRFEVRLPLKPNADQLDSCRTLALKRFYMLENRLQRNPELKAQYVEFIREYLQLGHCREINEATDSPDKKPYYMPHHAVLRPGSSTTKCRVVFDASAKSASTNLSLNDVLLVGPVVQSDIMFIMLRFRQHRYVFTADITKMYRQIRVHPDDTHKQRIFWRENPSDPLKVLELLTVTYGTASAPYQATRSLVQLASDEREKFPVAAKIIKHDCYVDDVLSGTATIDEAVEAQRQLKEMLARAGFPIHKWCSNSQQLLDCIPIEEREPLKPLEDRHVNNVIKVLGLLWEPTTDELLIAGSAKPAKPTDKNDTKRTIYSEVAKLYDPLGLFAPSILLAKLHVQQLWQRKLDWDEPVDDEYQELWTTMRTALPGLLDIKVPRQVTFDGATCYEVHAFGDASTLAYGACIYVRSSMPDGTAKARLLTSKSKVAPLHVLSIPRKELCASLLVTRLLAKVLPALTIPVSKVVLYSDSQIVLAWLKKHPYQLETFIGNRVGEIQASTEGYPWIYVRTDHNPADIVSRGLLPIDLQTNELWWNGPNFLTSSAVYSEQLDDIPDDELPELKKTVIATPALILEQLPVFEKFSCFRKLQRVVAWVLRFKNNALKPKEQRVVSRHHTVSELRQSMLVIVRVIQHLELGDEIHRLETKTPCKRIANLNPTYTDGLLRVGGRLEYSHLPAETKHQLILPNKNSVTKLLLTTLHRELKHIGPAGLISATRQRYWLLGSRSAARQVTRSCVKCFRTNPTGVSQLMGELPSQRVRQSPPFSITGVDYAGPILVKQGSYRPKTVKAYIAVYVCMVTKGVHLELVSDLTTDAFLASLQRFIGRRGIVSQIHSDNATNFHGANNELHRLFRMFRNPPEVDRIVQYCNTREIEWHFIPPDAPEFGGLWEAAVKSAKTHLKRVIGNATLTFEEMTTILVEIEAVLNSRPLFAISNDPADPEVITPAHYLINRPLTALPEPSYSDININRLSRWQHLQLMREQFWKTWSHDYLQSLQVRKKNWNVCANVRPGMVVLIHEKNRPPLQWKLGRITAVYPGSDGLVRVVTVFSEGASRDRPITKLSILPIDENQGKRDTSKIADGDASTRGEDVPYGSS